MKKTIAMFVAMFMLVAFASVSMAAEKKAPKTQITGEVTKFEAAKSITVKGKDAEVTADLGKKTKVVGGEVKVGSTVTLMFGEANGVKVAKKIEVKKAAAAPKAAAPAPAAAPAAAPKK